MADLEFIAPTKTTTVTFDLAPAYNVLSSLVLLEEQLPGFSDWVRQTASGLSEEVLLTNQLVASAASLFFDHKPWPSFPAFIDHLESLDSNEMRDREVEKILQKGASYLEDDSNLPTAEELLADRERYLAFIEEVLSCKEYPFDRVRSEKDYALLIDPPARKELMISHLRNMWEDILAEEWENNLPMLRECAQAFEALDLRGMSIFESIQHVVDREVPDEWVDEFEGLENIILIPSPHIGPYLLMISKSETTARIIFGARMPKGTLIQSPALNRSELVARMSALANDTRLTILHLLSQEGELGSQDIISRLDLSQSAASRHLQHLKVTGYIIEQRKEGGKVFRLNSSRINDIFQALQDFLT
jgi:DNA-binding transcriptional ArsR family regulator